MKPSLSHCSHPLHVVGWSSAYPLHNVGQSSLPPRIAHILSAARDVAVFIALLSSPLRQSIKLSNSIKPYLRALLSLCSHPLHELGWSFRFLLHCSHSLHDEGWSPAPPRITWIPFQNRSVFLPHLPFGLGGFSLNQPGQVSYYHYRPLLISLWFSSSAIPLG